MRCDICGTAHSEYFYKNEEQTLCEECILNSDMICTSTNYYLDGEYIGDSESLEFLERLSFNNICEILGYEEIKNEEE